MVHVCQYRRSRGTYADAFVDGMCGADAVDLDQIVVDFESFGCR
jgi:hypothetical protein